MRLILTPAIAAALLTQYAAAFSVSTIFRPASAPAPAPAPNHHRQGTALQAKNGGNIGDGNGKKGFSLFSSFLSQPKNGSKRNPIGPKSNSSPSSMDMATIESDTEAERDTESEFNSGGKRRIEFKVGDVGDKSSHEHELEVEAEAEHFMESLWFIESTIDLPKFEKATEGKAEVEMERDVEFDAEFDTEAAVELLHSPGPIIIPEVKPPPAVVTKPLVDMSALEAAAEQKWETKVQLDAETITELQVEATKEQEVISPVEAAFVVHVSASDVQMHTETVSKMDLCVDDSVKHIRGLETSSENQVEVERTSTSAAVPVESAVEHQVESKVQKNVITATEVAIDRKVVASEPVVLPVQMEMGALENTVEMNKEAAVELSASVLHAPEPIIVSEVEVEPPPATPTPTRTHTETVITMDDQSANNAVDMRAFEIAVERSVEAAAEISAELQVEAEVERDAERSVMAATEATIEREMAATQIHTPQAIAAAPVVTKPVVDMSVLEAAAEQKWETKVQLDAETKTELQVEAKKEQEVIAPTEAAFVVHLSASSLSPSEATSDASVEESTSASVPAVKMHTETVSQMNLGVADSVKNFRALETSVEKQVEVEKTSTSAAVESDVKNQVESKVQKNVISADEAAISLKPVASLVAMETTTEYEVESKTSSAVEKSVEQMEKIKVERDDFATTEVVSKSNTAAASIPTPEVSAPSAGSYMDQIGGRNPVKKYVPPAPKVPASTSGLNGYLDGVANAAPIASTTTKMPKVENAIKEETSAKPEMDVRSVEALVENMAEANVLPPNALEKSMENRVEAGVEIDVLGAVKPVSDGDAAVMDVNNAVDFANEKTPKPLLDVRSLEKTVETNIEAAVEYSIASLQAESQVESDVELKIEALVELLHTPEPIISKVRAPTPKFAQELSAASVGSYMDQIGGSDPVKKYVPPAPKVPASTSGLTGYLDGVANAAPIAFTTTKVTKVENSKPEIDMRAIETMVEQSAEASTWAEVEAGAENDVLAETEAISEINVAATDMLTPEVPAFKKYVPPAPKVPASTNGSTGYLAGVANAAPVAFTAAKVPKVENTIKMEETPAKPEIDMHAIEAALAETEAISEINVAATDMHSPKVPAFKKYVPPAPKVPASTNGSTGHLAAKVPKVANTIKVEETPVKPEIDMHAIEAALEQSEETIVPAPNALEISVENEVEIQVLEDETQLHNFEQMAEMKVGREAELRVTVGAFTTSKASELEIPDQEAQKDASPPIEEKSVAMADDTDVLEAIIKSTSTTSSFLSSTNSSIPPEFW